MYTTPDSTHIDARPFKNDVLAHLKAPFKVSQLVDILPVWRLAAKRCDIVPVEVE